MVHFRPSIVLRSRAAISGLQTLFVVGILALVVPASVVSMPLAVLCLSVVMIAIAALIAGIGNTGSAFIVLGFGAVPLNDLHAAGGVEFSDVFFVTGFILLAPRLLSSTLRLPVSFIVGAGGLITIGTLSALANGKPAGDFQVLVPLVIGVVAVPVLLVWWQPGHRTTIAAVVAYLLGNGANVVSAIIDGGLGSGRAVGLTTHPNVMGLCQLLSLALVPFLWAVLPRQFAGIVGFAAFVFLYGIWISGSRAALAVAIALVLLYPLFKRSVSASLTVATLCLPAIALIARESQDPDPTNALGRLLGGGGSANSNVAREDGFKEGLNQFLTHPLLGGGWDGVWGVHNAYLQIAAGIGLFGFFFYLMMLLPVVKPLVSVRFPYGLLAGPGLAAAMVAVVDPGLGSRYIWAIIALAMGAERLALGSDDTPDPATQSESYSGSSPPFRGTPT